jgi:hypothetical protein
MKNEFLLDYSGDLIDPEVADKQSNHEYIYYFKIGRKTYRYMSTLCSSLMLLGNFTV